MKFHSYQPAEGHGLAHNPLPAIIGPRPIAWIASQSPEGVMNLAPYSFFNLFNYMPPIIAFSSVGWKDSIRNIEATRQFVCHIAGRALAEQLNATSAALPAGDSEFAYAGLTPCASTRVAAPRVQEAPIALECQVTQIVQLQTATGEHVPTWMVLSEIVQVHIREDVLHEGMLSLSKLMPILRGGGASDYYTVKPETVFHMHRPKL